MQGNYQLENEESLEAFFYEDLASITEVKQAVLTTPSIHSMWVFKSNHY
ncbi:hypothetical protein [Shouchella patagoniensis]|nr:hypothetical protein [Shouchella patagoniensis]